MSTATQDRTAAPTRYTAGPDRDAIVAEAIGCITGGRPLPAFLRPQPCDAPGASCVEEGIRRILAGCAARPRG